MINPKGEGSFSNQLDLCQFHMMLLDLGYLGQFQGDVLAVGLIDGD